MSKETFYFSHDYNVRSDIKIKRLIQAYGFEGYGIYWSLIEELYQNDNNLPLDYECFSYDMRVDIEIIKGIVNDFDLFKLNDENFGSLSVQKRMDERDAKSRKAKTSAMKRWDDGNSEARKSANDCIFYIIEIYNDNEKFIKAGITTESVSRRYSGKLSGYKYNLLYSCENSTETCLGVEREINETFDSYNPIIKFAGHMECYNVTDSKAIKDIAMQKLGIRNADNEIRNAKKESKVKESKVKETIKTWKTDYQIYLSESRVAYQYLLQDKEFIKKLSHAFPSMNIKKSIENSFVLYWSTDDGWKRKIKAKGNLINWKTTIQNSIKINAVYNQKSDVENTQVQQKSEIYPSLSK